VIESGEKVRSPVVSLTFTTCALTEPEGVAAEEVVVAAEAMPTAAAAAKNEDLEKSIFVIMVFGLRRN